MSKTVLTKGWPGPKGKCDMCDKEPATHWFGDTSVALCGSEKCAQRNWDNWKQLCEDMKREEEERENGW
jgi:hypothetical protein